MEKTNVRGVNFDLSINIPTLILIFTTFVSVVVGWVRLSDTQSEMANELAQQTSANAKVSQHLYHLDTKMIVLDQRLNLYPLHRHVGPQILYDTTPAGGLTADSDDPAKGQNR